MSTEFSAKKINSEKCQSRVNFKEYYIITSSKELIYQQSRVKCEILKYSEDYFRISKECLDEKQMCTELSKNSHDFIRYYSSRLSILKDMYKNYLNEKKSILGRKNLLENKLSGFQIKHKHLLSIISKEDPDMHLNESIEEKSRVICVQK